MEERAYLSVIQWAEGASHDDIVHGLVAAAGIDPHQSRLIASRGFPAVVARIDALVAQEVVASFRDLGVLAFAPTQHELASFPEPFLAKRLIPEQEGVYLVEPWRGMSTVLHTRGVFQIVRATLRTTQRQVVIDGPRQVTASSRMMRHLGSRFFRAFHDTVGGRPGHISTRIQTTEMLDVYFRNGERIRFNADKLSFDVLGSDRGYSDRENMTKLLAKLAAQAPQAVVDENYASFRCPPEFIREHSNARGSRNTSEAPAFDFYSVWAYWLHAARLGG
ncbi:MAG: hypothetical protein KF866_10435 [Phycisphaeraceae bacterium]|nr:hypothetical protein [Phycisphaeraceae bacterium]